MLECLQLYCLHCTNNSTKSRLQVQEQLPGRVGPFSWPSTCAIEATLFAFAFKRKDAHQNCNCDCHRWSTGTKLFSMVLFGLIGIAFSVALKQPTRSMLHCLLASIGETQADLLEGKITKISEIFTAFSICCVRFHGGWRSKISYTFREDCYDHRPSVVGYELRF